MSSSLPDKFCLGGLFFVYQWINLVQNSAAVRCFARRTVVDYT